MKAWKICLYILLTIFLAGCGPADSLNPLFTDKDVIFDSSLEGGWMAEDGGIRIARADDHGNRYRMITLNESGKCDAKADIYQAYLVNIGGHRFLDVVQERQPDPSVVNEIHLSHSKSKGVAKDPLLFYLGNDMYADFEPESSDTAATFKFRVRQAHWFVSVHAEDRKLQLAALDDDWVNKAVQKGTIKIAHVLLGADHKQLVLTATTEELQRFVREHEDDKEAFPPMSELHRID